MINTIYGKKVVMTGKYDEKGNRVGVTILKILQTTVKDARTKEKNGYQALRLLLKDRGDKGEKIKELRTDEVLEPGTVIKLDEVVKPGDVVKVSSISKGKGFAGVVKRHHFKGGPRTHGQSDRERAPGSSGSTTTPGRVLRGTRRAGHMGAAMVTTKGLKVLEVDTEKGQITIIGSVPGGGRGKGQLVTITKQA